ncbi:unnamed protein product [Vitrella brassicaformis CCMP3155]|uniref:Uncharacterized protein n=1 Tax=Vitrella brassicaformis (strain CCMP3155) TaxID=1169540 RepID=A0A0G4EIC8_VITBC|nr:unnamed protein product [Vitrella brassicaformis CCMP3155]|eukprot:CEL95998.1 unnamed protein product [Vitrella brassicaformis CCMP3155]
MSLRLTRSSWSMRAANHSAARAGVTSGEKKEELYFHPDEHFDEFIKDICGMEFVLCHIQDMATDTKTLDPFWKRHRAALATSMTVTLRKKAEKDRISTISLVIDKIRHNIQFLSGASGFVLFCTLKHGTPGYTLMEKYSLVGGVVAQDVEVALKGVLGDNATFKRENKEYRNKTKGTTYTMSYSDAHRSMTTQLSENDLATGKNKIAQMRKALNDEKRNYQKLWEILTDTDAGRPAAIKSIGAAYASGNFPRVPRVYMIRRSGKGELLTNFLSLRSWMP